MPTKLETLNRQGIELFYKWDERIRHVEQCSHYGTASAATQLMQSYAHFLNLTVGMNAGNSLGDRDKKERKTKDGILQNLRCSILEEMFEGQNKL